MALAGLRKMSETIAVPRDAATSILWRKTPEGPQILMGQRGAQAVFMPSKYVFPGGALDAADHQVEVTVAPDCARLLGEMAAPLAAAAIRELAEETGLYLGNPSVWPGEAPEGWADFAARGLCPEAAGLQFVFRAITPPGRPRRFDARFFLADARTVFGNLDDFSAASAELSHLHWIGLEAVRALDLPFITEVVLAEVTALLRGGDLSAGVPFFDNSGATPCFRRIV